MPEKVPNEEIDENAARPEVLPTAPTVPKPQPVELEFDEADVLFRKRNDI
jgi:hypothetical protein